jgi:hypothetical protein
MKYVSEVCEFKIVNTFYLFIYYILQLFGFWVLACTTLENKQLLFKLLFTGAVQ